MSKQLPIPNKEELENFYVDEGMSISAVARHFNTSNPTVRKWLDHHSIERKSHKEICQYVNSDRRRNIPSKEILERHYQTSSIKDLERVFNVGQETIYKWLTQYDLSIRSLSESCTIGKEKQNKDKTPGEEEFRFVYERYQNYQLVADHFNISYSFVKTLAKKYDVETVIPWRSQGEIRLFNRLNENGGWITNNKSLINPFELDMVCHDKKIAVEYCGLYWHSEGYGNKHRNYHRDKMRMCNEKGYRLFTVLETDDQNIVCNIVTNALGIKEKLYARNLTVREIGIEDAKPFHTKYHLHGYVGSSVHFGLYDGSMLVQVLSIGKSRFNKKYEYECTRMTVHGDYSVVGGASRLFKRFNDVYRPESIITYADLRYGTGKVYEKCGFEYEGTTEPNYWYFNKNNPTQIYSRVAFQKHKLVDMESYDNNLTEYQIMKLNGWDRVWDCGNAIFVQKRC